MKRGMGAILPGGEAEVWRRRALVAEERMTTAEAKLQEAVKVIDDLFSLVETSSRWFHDSTLWEQESYDDYLPPQWQAIRNRAAALSKGNER